MPLSLVVVLVTTPVATFRTLTLAWGITAPVESVTVPLISPELAFCDHAGCAPAKLNAMASNVVRVVISFTARASGNGAIVVREDGRRPAIRLVSAESRISRKKRIEDPVSERR